MLSELAVYFGQKEEINRFLKNICLYPCLVLSLAIVTGCLFVVKLLPLFADLYQSFDLVPTLPLQVMMFVREIAVKYWQAAASLSLFILYYLWQRRYSLLKWCFCLLSQVIDRRFWKYDFAKYCRCFLIVEFRCRCR